MPMTRSRSALSGLVAALVTAAAVFLVSDRNPDGARAVRAAEPPKAEPPKGAARLDPNQVLYKTVKIDGLDVFYREAGPKDAPTILPTSSTWSPRTTPASATVPPRRWTSSLTPSTTWRAWSRSSPRRSG
jgi:hypothetical protein